MSEFVKKIKLKTKRPKLLSIQCALAEEHVPTPKNTPPSIERRQKIEKEKPIKKLFDI